MHPVNALKTLVMKRLKELGLSKPELARRLGYRNINKGMRRIDAVLNAEGDEELTIRMLKELHLTEAKQRIALTDQELRKAKELLARRVVEREKFRRSLTLISSFEPTNWLGRWGAFLGSQVLLPLLGDQVSREEELAEVIRHFHQKLGVRYPEKGPPLDIFGFYYHRTYDHGFLCDREANLIREDHHHVAPTAIYILPTHDIDISQPNLIEEPQRGTRKGENHDQAE